MSATYYEEQLRPKLRYIADNEVRPYVDQLLAETEKEEIKKEEEKQKHEAPTADQGPKPMTPKMANLVKQLDNTTALASIRDSAGAEVHDLVVNLIKYAKSL